MNRFLITVFLLHSISLLCNGGESEIESKAPILNDEVPCAGKIFGDWGGARSALAEKGIVVNFDTTYTYQNVMDGGIHRFQDDHGHYGSAKLGIVLDTGKAGLWPGGFLTVRAEGRVDDPFLARTGVLNPVNNDALFPLVPGSLGEDVFALNELMYAQFLTEKFGFVMGLINTDTGDANPIAGFIGSNEYFLNTGFLYSSVTSALVPTATPGGGVVWIPNAENQFKFLVVGSTETAGYNPFDYYEGTTFIAEWVTKYEAFGNPGGMTFDAYYGVDRGGVNVAADPRILIGNALAGRPLPSSDETWALSWNGYQYLSGDEKQGWGIFGRLGITDGDPNITSWNAAIGLGGVGLCPSRPCDRWGIGLYHQDFTESGIIPLLGIDSETGGEVFYNIAVCPGVNVTLDLQVIDSAIPTVDTVVVGGARVRMDW